jgi:primosomal protein N'
MMAKVIPARRMPWKLSELDYAVPDELAGKISIGHLVKIPFLKKEIFGIVSALSNGKSAVEQIKIKNISSIEMVQPALSSQQMAFLSDIAEFYRTSLGFLLKGNLLPLQKRKLAKLNSAEPPAKNISKKISGKPVFFSYGAPADKLKFITDEISGTDGQILLLVPELPDIAAWKKILPDELKEKTVFVTGELGNKELFSVWMQIWLGEKKFVIGTRRALFLPWFNLQKIFLDDEGNPDYKSWDMAPRFHTRDAAMFLARHHQARLYLLSHTPSVETYFFCKQNTYEGWEHLEKMPAVKKFPDIVDMRSERKGGNYNFLSDELVQKITDDKRGDIFIFVNRRGSASYVGCRDCGNVIKCPKCGFSLTFHEADNLLKCHYCGYSEPMRSHCSVCGGVNMTMYGVGTQQVENSVHKLLKPGDARAVIRIDSDNNDLKKLETEGNKIIIATQLAWPYLDWKKICLMAFLDFDTPLFIPEYKIAENLWQMLRDAQMRMEPATDFILQTNHPDHLLIVSLGSPNQFYEEQLKERRIMQYPPYKFLLKLSFGHSEKAAASGEAARLKTFLLSLTKDIKSIKITGPFDASPHYYGGQYWQVILAKIGFEDYKKYTKLMLSIVPETWKADPNPSSILYQ